MTHEPHRLYGTPGLLRIERRKRKTRLRVGYAADVVDLRPAEIRGLIGLLVGELCRLDLKGIR